MKFLAKAIVTGFGLSVGAALYKKLSTYLGIDDKDNKDAAKEAEKVTMREGVSDAELQA